MYSSIFLCSDGAVPQYGSTDLVIATPNPKAARPWFLDPWLSLSVLLPRSLFSSLPSLSPFPVQILALCLREPRASYRASYRGESNKDHSKPVCASLLSRDGLSATSWTVAHQAPLPMEFSRQEYWSGLPFPPPGDLPDPGIELKSLVSPA